MKLLLICLDGVRIDMALPHVAQADHRFAAPGQAGDPRFARDPGGPAPDHSISLEEASGWGVLAPTLERLATAGQYSDGVVLPMWMTPPTDSGPGWSSILTGSTHEQCNVWWNEFVGNHLAQRPDVLTRLWAANPAATTLVASSWDAFADPSGPGPIFQQRIDQQRVGQHQVLQCLEPDLVSADAQLCTRATWALNHHGPDASVVYLQQVDAAGHRHGADSVQYRDAIRRVDEHVRYLVKAVAERHEALGEEWLLAVTTDHGHKPEGGHGEDEVEVRRSFLLLHRIGAALPGWVRDHDTLLPEEVTPLLLGLLGVAEGEWRPDHRVGRHQDIPSTGPSRDLRFEW